MTKLGNSQQASSNRTCLLLLEMVKPDALDSPGRHPLSAKM